MTRLRLFDDDGQRLFFDYEERAAFLRAADEEEGPTRTFCQVLHYTGCNLPEAIGLTAGQIDIFGRNILLEGTTVNRSVPVPDALIDLLEEVHDISAQSGREARTRLWTKHPQTMRDKLTRIIRDAGIAGGPHAMPMGIRFGFFVHAVSRGVIVTRAERWMGYSRNNKLADYIEQLARRAPDVVGDERRDASLMW
jgi:integrase